MGKTTLQQIPGDKCERFATSSTVSRVVSHMGLIKSQASGHGIWATAKWLVGKTIFSRWTAVVFADDPLLDRIPSAWPEGYHYQAPVRVSQLSPQHAQLLRAAHQQHLAAQLAPGDELYWVTHEQAVVSVGALLHRSPQRSVLGLPAEALLIGHCETAPAHRNQGLYACAINDTLIELKRRGASGVFMETRTGNVASQRGILRAGLLQQRVVHAKIFLRSIVVREDGMGWIRRS
jgi:hypothetical protein